MCDVRLRQSPLNPRRLKRGHSRKLTQSSLYNWTEAYSKTPQHKDDLIDVESSLSKDRMVMMEVPFGPDRGSEQEGSPPDPV
ncbi:hypothetical protein CUMW_048240 [Citrus unshiu]|nr:hypothetical protein CUMW_048240 [Citrus unshiu]